MDDQHQSKLPDSDPLADLIRHAGRRPMPPQDHYDSVRAATRYAWQRKVQSRKRVRRIYALAAAIALASLTVLISYQFQLTSGDPIALTQILHGDVQILRSDREAWQQLDRIGLVVEAGDRLRTGASAGVALMLENGVSLRLNSDTELTISSVESVSLLAGSAYVDTGVHESTNSMTVTTPFGSVRDIGTQFEVFTSPTSVRVRVRTGSIEWSQADRNTKTDAAEQLDVSSGGGIRKSAFPRNHPDWDWIQRLASPPTGQDRTILSYLQWVAGEMGRDLRFESTNTALRAEIETMNRDLSGLTPTEILDLIPQVSDFEYQFQEDGEILVTRQ